MINKSTAPQNVFQAGESWTLTDQPHMHVLQERMPPGHAERRHLRFLPDEPRAVRAK